jgi:hypothetical protein
MSAAVKYVLESVHTLSDGIEGSELAQLVYESGACRLLVTRPQPPKPISYALWIGPFHKSGKITELANDEIEDAIVKLESMSESVINHFRIKHIKSETP